MDITTAQKIVNGMTKLYNLQLQQTIIHMTIKIENMQQKNFVDKEILLYLLDHDSAVMLYVLLSLPAFMPVFSETLFCIVLLLSGKLVCMSNHKNCFPNEKIRKSLTFPQADFFHKQCPERKVHSFAGFCRVSY